MTLDRRSPQVLIVGAGPVGLTLAIQLRRLGVPLRIIDGAEGPSRETKAMAIHARTLEVFDDLGVVRPFLDHGVRTERFVAYFRGRPILTYHFDRLRTVYPFLLSLPQPQTEHFLAKRLRELGVEVERRLEVVTLSQDEHEVEVTLRPSGGTSYRSCYPWVVGCDGGRSVVRRDVGISFEGASYHRYFMLTDVDLDWEGSHREGAFFLGAGEGYVGLAPIPGASRYRFFVEMPHDIPAEHERPPLCLETFQRIASERGQRMKLSNPSSMTMAEFRHRMADRLRSGRVFLAGDAAHIGSPIGGQYMNLGINEAYNLGWKLAYVLRGRADDRLLDSYEAERLPIARQAERTAHVLTRLFTLTNPLALLARNRVLPVLSKLPAVRDRLPRGVSGHAYHYRGLGATAEQVAPARVRRPASGSRQRRVCAGDLAPDVRLDHESGGDRRLSHTFDHTRCTLLLFGGEVGSPERFAWLAHIARRVVQRYPDTVVPVIVWPRHLHTAASPETPVILDGDARAHAAYGAQSGGFFVVRPDGYLGYVGPDGLEGDLRRYLERTLRLRDTAAALVSPSLAEVEA